MLQPIGKSTANTVYIILADKIRLDGLNKELDPWDLQYYMGEFRNLCAKEKMHELQWPQRDYIIQVARFDPAKGGSFFFRLRRQLILLIGIPNVIDSYARFRRALRAQATDFDEEEHPQLLVCGHGAVDDPDASIIYDQIIQLIASDAYKEFACDIVVMRLPPSDQRKSQEACY